MKLKVKNTVFLYLLSAYSILLPLGHIPAKSIPDIANKKADKFWRYQPATEKQPSVGLGAFMVASGFFYSWQAKKMRPDEIICNIISEVLKHEAEGIVKTYKRAESLDGRLFTSIGRSIMACGAAYSAYAVYINYIQKKVYKRT